MKQYTLLTPSLHAACCHNCTAWCECLCGTCSGVVVHVRPSAHYAHNSWRQPAHARHRALGSTVPKVKFKQHHGAQGRMHPPCRLLDACRASRHGLRACLQCSRGLGSMGLQGVAAAHMLQPPWLAHRLVLTASTCICPGMLLHCGSRTSPGAWRAAPAAPATTGAPRSTRPAPG